MRHAVMRGFKAVFISLALALLAATLLSGSAFGSHDYSAASGVPDNTHHCVDRNSLTSDSNDATLRGIIQLNRTKMTVSLSCSGDVEVYDAYYGTSADWSGVAGKTNCQQWTSTPSICDVYRVRFNLTYSANYSTTLTKSLGRHEFGHTAGLGHSTASNDSNDNSCMRSTVDPPTFDTHDLDAINSTPM